MQPVEVLTPEDQFVPGVAPSANAKPLLYSQKTRAETDWSNVLVKVLASESVFYQNTGPDAAGKPKGRGASGQNEAFLRSGQPTVGWGVGQVVSCCQKDAMPLYGNRIEAVHPGARIW